jgi:hypothetical protein
MILHWQCIIKASVVNGRLLNSNSIYTQDLLLNSSVEYDTMLKVYQSADICLPSAEGFLKPDHRKNQAFAGWKW